MATLGAELGCGRHLASTVVTGSAQRSSTFLAELCLSTVLVLALRAFHCRPRRKKGARCTARVTSRMVDASRFLCGGQERHRRLLCPRCQRPPRRRAAEKRDELAAFDHSITPAGAVGLPHAYPVTSRPAGPLVQTGRCWPTPPFPNDDSTSLRGRRLLRCGISARLMTALGQRRRRQPGPVIAQMPGLLRKRPTWGRGDERPCVP
jgi:hypothetical protein